MNTLRPGFDAARAGPSTEQLELEQVRQLVLLGACHQLLASVSKLPSHQLKQIFTEVHGQDSLMLTEPYSTDWFAAWQPSIHASLFITFYQRFVDVVGKEDADTLIRAYRLYREQINLIGLADILSITCAWRLIQLLDSGNMALTACKHCGGQFIAQTSALWADYRCGLCVPPPNSVLFCTPEAAPQFPRQPI